MCDNLYNSLNYNNSISDLKEIEKNELVSLIEKLDSESLETIYTLILYDYSKNFPNSKVIFPYKSKQNDDNIEIKLDGLPIRLKRIIFKFVKIASLKDADTINNQTQLTTNLKQNNKEKIKEKTKNDKKSIDNSKDELDDQKTKNNKNKPKIIKENNETNIDKKSKLIKEENNETTIDKLSKNKTKIIKENEETTNDQKTKNKTKTLKTNKKY